MEPQDVTTVSRKALVHFGDDDAKVYAKAAATYRANLLRNCPECFTETGRVNPAALARRENNDPRRPSSSSMARDQGKPAPAELTPRLIAQRAAQAAKTASTRLSILEALAQPGTAVDVARVVNRESHHVRRYLVLMAADGIVTGRNVKGVTVWERRQEAAE
jgi:predicted transcriptional regulator